MQYPPHGISTTLLKPRIMDGQTRINVRLLLRIDREIPATDLKPEHILNLRKYIEAGQAILPDHIDELFSGRRHLLITEEAWNDMKVFSRPRLLFFRNGASWANTNKHFLGRPRIRSPDLQHLPRSLYEAFEESLLVFSAQRPQRS